MHNMRFQKDGFLYVWNSLDMPIDDKIVLTSISYCESGFKIDAVNNKNKNGTSDGGLFQINSVHKLSDVTDPQSNINKAVELYTKNGTRDWNSSKHCWSKVIDSVKKDLS